MGDEPTHRGRILTVLIVAGAGCFILGVVLVLFGPVRWAQDRAEAAKQRETAATLATCIRFQSLVERAHDGPVPAPEMRSRVTALARGAEYARADVLAAVSELQGEVTATGVVGVTPAWDTLRASCAIR